MRPVWLKWVRGVVAATALVGVLGTPAALASHRHRSGRAVSPRSHGGRLGRIRHIVVIYQENHSFDNLYGGWEGVNGLANARRARKRQVSQSGTRFRCLLQNDLNLASPSPLPTRCTDTTTGSSFESAFR